MARVRIGDRLIEGAALSMTGGRLAVRWPREDEDTLDGLAALIGSAKELRELDADSATVALYAVRGLISLRADVAIGTLEAVVSVDPMEVGAAELLGQRIEAQGRELGDAIAQQGAELGDRIDGQAALLGAARVAARRTVAADADVMTADELAACVPLFGDWSGGGVAYAVGDIVAHGGALYRCVQAHTSQAGWTPDASRALWTPLGVRADDPEAAPEWVQPTGSHDAYPQGAHVTHGGIEWVSDTDGNVWEPGVSGWSKAGGDAG